MARIYLPPLRPIPEGATEEDRHRLYEEYRADLVRFNPRHFNADGSLKTFWQLLRGVFG